MSSYFRLLQKDKEEVLGHKLIDIHEWKCAKCDRYFWTEKNEFGEMMCPFCGATSYLNDKLELK